MTKMMEKLPFDVAIPFYSTPDYLLRAIRSVLSQTDPGWSLLVCDDDSHHSGLRELVASFGDGRIRYVRNKKNLGQAGNWNRCFDLTHHPYLTLLHADDELKPNYISVMRRNLGKHADAALLFCQAEIINGQGQSAFSAADWYKKHFLLPSRHNDFELFGEEGLCALLKGNFIMCPTICYRRDALGSRRFSTFWKCVSDLEFITGLILSGMKIVGVPEIAFRYRRHEASGTAQMLKDLSLLEEEGRLFDTLREKAVERGWMRAASLAAQKSIIKKRAVFCALQDMLSFRLRPSLAKLRFLSTLF